MTKVPGTDSAIAIFNKYTETKSISECCSLFKIPLQVGYALKGGHLQMLGSIYIRRILAYEANRLKNERTNKAIETVEHQHYKGTRNNMNAIPKQHHESMHSL